MYVKIIDYWCVFVINSIKLMVAEPSVVNFNGQTNLRLALVTKEDCSCLKQVKTVCYPL